jgi:small GTP-binding protein
MESDARFLQPLKCVVVGDGGVGKTSLLMSYTSKTFPTEYTPTIFDNFNAVITIDNKAYNLGLWDTAGQEEYDKMRTVSYPHTDVFVLCFSLVQPNSFANVKNRWYPELKEYCPTTPILLVGTKLDLTNDDATMRSLARQSLAPVTRDQALKIAEELKLEGYVECSGLTQAGVKVVFDEAAHLAVGKPLDGSGLMASGSSKKLKKSSSGASDKKGACCILM